MNTDPNPWLEFVPYPEPHDDTGERTFKICTTMTHERDRSKCFGRPSSSHAWLSFVPETSAAVFRIEPVNEEENDDTMVHETFKFTEHASGLALCVGAGPSSDTISPSPPSKRPRLEARFTEARCAFSVSALADKSALDWDSPPRVDPQWEDPIYAGPKRADNL